MAITGLAARRAQAVIDKTLARYPEKRAEILGTAATLNLRPDLHGGIISAFTRRRPVSEPVPQPGQDPAIPFALPSTTVPVPTMPQPTNDMPGGGIPGTGAIPGIVVGAAWNWFRDRFAGPSSSETQCAPGRVKIGNQCVDPGAALPGGTPLTVPAGGGTVMGAFGVPALVPTVVGEVTSNAGQTTVIRRCPSKFVLGGDNLCYPKGSIPNNLRKWPKTARPPVSAYDARMMRKYGQGGSKQQGVKRLAMQAGFTCAPKGTLRRRSSKRK